MQILYIVEVHRVTRHRDWPIDHLVHADQQAPLVSIQSVAIHALAIEVLNDSCLDVISKHDELLGRSVVGHVVR